MKIRLKCHQNPQLLNSVQAIYKKFLIAKSIFKNISSKWKRFLSLRKNRIKWKREKEKKG